MSAHTDTHTIVAESRTLVGHQAKQLRTQGKIPAVVYGNIKKNLNITLDARVFSKLFHQVGHTTLLNLKVDGEKAVKVLVQDITFHATKEDITHVDFYAVNLKEKLTTEVPLEFVGEAPAVEVEGGIFVTVRSEIEIECLPENLPQHIEVDISSLKTADDTIRVKDIVLPEGVTTHLDAEETIAAITEPISEEELASLDEAPSTEPTTEFETTSGTEKPVEETK